MSSGTRTSSWSGPDDGVPGEGALQEGARGQDRSDHLQGVELWSDTQRCAGQDGAGVGVDPDQGIGVRQAEQPTAFEPTASTV